MLPAECFYVYRTGIPVVIDWMDFVSSFLVHCCHDNIKLAVSIVAAMTRTTVLRTGWQLLFFSETSASICSCETGNGGSSTPRSSHFSMSPAQRTSYDRKKKNSTSLERKSSRMRLPERNWRRARHSSWKRRTRSTYNCKRYKQGNIHVRCTIDNHATIIYMYCTFDFGYYVVPAWIEQLATCFHYNLPL